MDSRFIDRADAGRKLAPLLRRFKGRSDVLVLALPRGGVPVGYEVAHALGVPLDICVVRKLGVPGHEELAMGAIGPGGVRVLNTDVIAALRIPDDVLNQVAHEEQRELQRRASLYRGDRPWPDLKGKTVILVDDGLATGSTMRAAVAAVRAHQPAQIVVAVPTASPFTVAEFRQIADECLSVLMPEPFQAVGLWYQDFNQTSDEDVRRLLESAPERENRADNP